MRKAVKTGLLSSIFNFKANLSVQIVHLGATVTDKGKVAAAFPGRMKKEHCAVRKSPRWGPGGRKSGCADPKWSASGSSHENGSFQSLLGFSALVLRGLLLYLEEGRNRTGLHFQKALGALALPLCRLAGKVPHILQSHVVTVEIEAQRQVSCKHRLKEGNPYSHFRKQGPGMEVRAPKLMAGCPYEVCSLCLFLHCCPILKGFSASKRKKQENQH
ncbi:uncharacterized protein LOC122440808 [Cervus canadensis]|uniref:uncharacterized protein LOC122440808 n=1 Tax=Cervus canadensis TaxID=1574408 RepID=UPI001C9E88B5|nr:uncharacterized protein LOC122440808 [Cervus canadensis]